ncbi:MAG: CchlO [Frankiales bacterium]|nr:CchlO [Frankiales bacterium]
MVAPAAVVRAAVVKNPLTGLAPRKVPLVVIKVDNASTAWPYQRGISHAAVVYQELVESGLTRFAAVYDGSWSGEVGPIRSARETDIALLAQYGRVTLAFSGANKGVMHSVLAAAHKQQIIDASHENFPSLYREGPRRKDSYNFFSTPNRLRAARPGVLAKDIGFRFAPLPRHTGRTANAATIRFSAHASVVVRYDKRTGRYAVYQDGHRMAGVAPANVIVQRVTVRGSRYVDVLGSPTPYTVTTGRGSAVLLRDGHLIAATWRRLTVKTGTRFLDAHGRDVPMKPGPTWVLLQPSGRPFSYS